MRTSTLIPALALLAALPTANAQPLIYEGTLNGLPPAAQTVTLRFTIYDAPIGGQAWWTSGNLVLPVDQGRFVAELEAGPAGPIAPIHVSGQRWLEVIVVPPAAPDVILTPRQRIGRVPQALEAIETAVRGLTPERPGASCADVLTSGGRRSGVYWITHPDHGRPVEMYCDQVTHGGGWAVLYNSVIGVNTTEFWQLVYADRLQRFGRPSLDSNFYDGSLYLPVDEIHYARLEFLDVVEGLRGRSVPAMWARARTIDTDTMQLVDPENIDEAVGISNWFDGHFAAGWSSSDQDGDNDDRSNCARVSSGVAQHYAACWVMNLGSDYYNDPDNGDSYDDGVGPHIVAGFAERLGLADDDTRNTRVRRITRLVRW
ncbi:MAG: hypothetical protein H6701_04835 [Myxococcales bacterium]|nr:hypothetical protein [Myxococcales bacterium]MCB9551758.1 hypothetical protein [Myxococcales bacterium]